jgi:hypothetical protein
MTATAPRPHGWTTLAELTCPSGHHIRQDAILLEHGAIRCKHKIQGRPRDKGFECGAWLCVLGSVGWTVTEDADGREHVQLGDHVYVAAVTYDELRRIRAHRLGAAAALALLGIAWRTLHREPAVAERRC